jgi:GntR family phosphonate transport system transcriptional regulator
LRREISAGAYGHAFLPGEQTIATRFEVNRHTVRRAIDDLMAEGLVMREQGRPPRVLPRRVRYVIDPVRGASACFKEQGVTLITELRGMVDERADSQVAEALRLVPGTPVVRLELLRYANEQLLAVATLYFPSQPWGSALAGYQRGSVHRYLEEHHGFRFMRESTSLHACLPEENDARLLDMSPRAAILVTQTINRDAESGETAEFAITRMRGDSIQVEVPF